MKKEGFSGLIPQTTCCLHIVHNAFHKGLNIYGEEPEELAFNMYYWFKSAPCKHEDFLKLEQGMDMEIHQSSFLHHINFQWLTLLPAIEIIRAQLPTVQKCFLDFLLHKKEVEKTLPKNKWVHRNSKFVKK